MIVSICGACLPGSLLPGTVSQQERPQKGVDPARTEIARDTRAAVRESFDVKTQDLTRGDLLRHAIDPRAPTQAFRQRDHNDDMALSRSRVFEALPNLRRLFDTYDLDSNHRFGYSAFARHLDDVPADLKKLRP